MEGWLGARRTSDTKSAPLGRAAVPRKASHAADPAQHAQPHPSQGWGRSPLATGNVSAKEPTYPCCHHASRDPPTATCPPPAASTASRCHYLGVDSLVWRVPRKGSPGHHCQRRIRRTSSHREQGLPAELEETNPGGDGGQQLVLRFREHSGPCPPTHQPAPLPPHPRRPQAHISAQLGSSRAQAVAPLSPFKVPPCPTVLCGDSTGNNLSKTVVVPSRAPGPRALPCRRPPPLS